MCMDLVLALDNFLKPSLHFTFSSGTFFSYQVMFLSLFS